MTDKSSAERTLRLNRLLAQTEVSAAASIKTAALKQSAPLAAPSMQIPVISPTAAEAAGEENIANAVSKGRMIIGTAFFMLILILSV